MSSCYSDEVLQEDAAMYDTAVHIVVETGNAQTSHLQRSLKCGYNRAARLIERMEAEGIVSDCNHVGKRTVINPLTPTP